MILNTVIGDITLPDNPNDIIIGMNTSLGEASAIGRPFVTDDIPEELLVLGGVLTFEFDESRKLHMLLCHELGQDGWNGAEKYVRFGMDYLWQRYHGEREFSVVKIGSGPIGQRDGADVGSILTAMADSYLGVVLYLRPPQPTTAAGNVIELPKLRFHQGWAMDVGRKVALLN